MDQSFRFRPNRPPVAPEICHAAVRHVPGTDGKFDPGRTCHACKNKRHWKGECPLSKAGQISADASVYVKPVGLVTSALHANMSEFVRPSGTVPFKHVDELYRPFGKGKVPVKILRDSGSNQSLILNSVLPFSAHTATGGKAPVLGVLMVTLWVLVHQFLPKIWQGHGSGKRVHHLCMRVQFCKCPRSLRVVLKRALK